MSGPNDQLAGNIVATVATAEAVLAQFRQSLVQAGFAEGALPYTRLADTIIAQRLWVESSGMAAEARFRAVGVHARALTELLQPYVEAFQRLSALAGAGLLEEAGTPDAPGSDTPGTDAAGGAPDKAGESVLAALADAGRPLSFTAVRDAVRLPRAELTAALSRLEETGRIERTRASGRDLIRRTARP